MNLDGIATCATLQGHNKYLLERFWMAELSLAHFLIAWTLLSSRCIFSCQISILNGFHVEREAKLTLESNHPTWEAKYARSKRIIG